MGEIRKESVSNRRSGAIPLLGRDVRKKVGDAAAPFETERSERETAADRSSVSASPGEEQCQLVVGDAREGQVERGQPVWVTCRKELGEGWRGEGPEREMSCAA